MIISHSRKFILLKSIKTAGTSIEAALSTYCDGDDVVTPLNKYAFNRDEESSVVHRDMNANQLNWWTKDIGQHVDVATLKSQLPKDIWDSYLKISIARNPWDRLVSLFTWRNKNSPALNPKRRFYHHLGVPFDRFAYIRRSFLEYARSDWETNDRFYVLKDELCVDYVIKYETLSQSFNELCDRLQVPRIELPQLKAGIRSTTHHYRDYFDDESKAIVSTKHRNDIRLFGYEF